MEREKSPTTRASRENTSFREKNGNVSNIMKAVAGAGAMLAVLNVTPSTNAEEGSAKHWTLQGGGVVSSAKEAGAQIEVNEGIGNHHKLHLELVPFSYSYLTTFGKHEKENITEFAAGIGPSLPISHSFTLSLLGELGPQIINSHEAGTHTNLIGGVKLKTTLDLNDDFMLYGTVGTHTVIPGISQGHASAHFPAIGSLGLGWKF